MAIAPRLDLRQSQTLVMTPQLRQAIKLLQFSNVEVNAFVDEEMERNPLLERDDVSDAPIGERAAVDQIEPRVTAAGDSADAAGAETLPADSVPENVAGIRVCPLIEGKELAVEKPPIESPPIRVAASAQSTPSRCCAAISSA